LHRLLLSVVEGTLERILETTFLALVHVNSLLFIGEQLVNSPSLVILELLVPFDFKFFLADCSELAAVS
jgi:hypothetical protein